MNRRSLFKALITLPFSGGLLNVAKQSITTDGAWWWQCSQCEGGTACDCQDGQELPYQMMFITDDPWPMPEFVEAVLPTRDEIKARQCV